MTSSLTDAAKSFGLKPDFNVIFKNDALAKGKFVVDCLILLPIASFCHLEISLLIEKANGGKKPTKTDRIRYSRVC